MLVCQQHIFHKVIMIFIAVMCVCSRFSKVVGAKILWGTTCYRDIMAGVGQLAEIVDG